MQYYVITKAGKDVVQLLRERECDEEAAILAYLHRNGASTVEQISDGSGIDYAGVNLMLRALNREGWVKQKRIIKSY